MNHGTLITLWYVLTGAILFLHLGLGGIDLGACILSLFLDDRDAERVLASIDGIWHSGQTWLVALGAVLFGAFPGFYATILPQVYGLVMLLLAALTVRGLGLEYRHEAVGGRVWRKLAGWGAAAVLVSYALLLASLLTPLLNHEPTLSLPHMIGTTLVPVLFFLLATVLLPCGAWLMRIMPLGSSTRLQTLAVWATLTGAMVLPLLTMVLSHRLAPSPALTRPFLLPLTAAGCVVLILLIASLRGNWKGSPLPWALALAGLCLGACAVSLYPLLSGLTLYAASPGALTFLSGATALLLPLLLVFQIVQYRLHLRHLDPTSAASTTSAGRG